MSRAERKDDTHQAILQSASRVMRLRGIAKTSVNEVMQGAGLTVGGFYAHFPTKTALMVETLRINLRQTADELLQGIGELAPEERMGRVLRRYLSRTHRGDRDNGCSLPAVVAELSHETGELRHVFAEEVQLFGERLGALLDLETDEALGLLALMYGGLSMARALEGTSLSDSLLRSAQVLGKKARNKETHHE